MHKKHKTQVYNRHKTQVYNRHQPTQNSSVQPTVRPVITCHKPLVWGRPYLSSMISLLLAVISHYCWLLTIINHWFGRGLYLSSMISLLLVVISGYITLLFVVNHHQPLVWGCRYLPVRMKIFIYKKHE